MNLPRYEFAQETEPDLLHFLKIAKQQKVSSKKCDLESYKVWSKLLPLDPILLKKLDECDTENAAAIIDLCSDDELEIAELAVDENIVIESETNDKSTISDIACTIKENLETQNDLSHSAKEHLAKCNATEGEDLFNILNQTLTIEESFYLGTCLFNSVSSSLISVFCSNILIPKIKNEYCDKIVKLLDQISTKYFPVLIEGCLKVLIDLKDEETKSFLLYIKKLNLNFQAVLVRDFILTIERLNENYLIIIETLLNNQVEYEALNKLVEMLSNVAEDHTRDKSFGKLLMHTIEVLGPNLILLEQPLKHIIAGHKSIWKSKLEKTFSSCYEDSLLFSQSFRD